MNRLITPSRSPRLRQPPIYTPGFAGSAITHHNPFLPTHQFMDWFTTRSNATHFEVTPIPFAALEQWHFEPATGNLRHTSGRFFSIEGINVHTNYGPVQAWSQPIINQPEIGILGIVVKEFQGVLYFLMQAKMEPGNVNLVQLAPTVQATRSNYTRVHQGARTRYLEYFVDKSRSQTLVDVLQSEQGSRFLRKRNRNMIVQVAEDIPLHDDFCWLTLGQIATLLRMDNLLNMDARTVLSCVPVGEWLRAGWAGVRRASKAHATVAPFTDALVASLAQPSQTLYPNSALVSWFTELKTRYELRVQSVGLDDVQQWHRGRRYLYHQSRRFFTVMAVAVRAGSREVTRWTQPIVKPRQQGVVAFLTRTINGVLHFLVQAKIEPGNFDTLEMAPTVQCLPSSYAHLPTEQRPPFLDYVLSAPPDQVRYMALQSEEGGRFYQKQTLSVIIEIDDRARLSLPDNYIWMTLAQLKEFIKYNNYLNVEARSLISCISLG